MNVGLLLLMFIGGLAGVLSTLYLSLTSRLPLFVYHSENLQKNPLRHLYYELEMSPRIFAKSRLISMCQVKSFGRHRPDT